MCVAINLLTEDPEHPSGAHWFWTRVIPEMAKRLESGEELHLLVSPKSRVYHQGYGPGVRHITFPWSNEHRNLRTLSEQLYSPVRLPLSRIDVFNTLMAPPVNLSWSLVLHFKTMHAYTAPGSVPAPTRVYRRMQYPRSARVADAIIINSESLRSEVQRYLEVDSGKLKLVYEAVDHELFRPGDAAGPCARDKARCYQTIFVVRFSLWPYKNCEGLLRLGAGPGDRDRSCDRRRRRDEKYVASLHSLAAELGIAPDIKFVGAIPLEETVSFYRAADAFVYPSFNETFGPPHSRSHGMRLPGRDLGRQRHAGDRGRSCGLVRPAGSRIDGQGQHRGPGTRKGSYARPRIAAARKVTWGATAASTLDVYHEAAERREHRRK